VNIVSLKLLIVIYYIEGNYNGYNLQMYLISSDYYETQAFYLLPGKVRLFFFSSDSQCVEMHLFIHSVLGSSL